MGLLRFSGKVITTFEGHVIGEISKPSGTVEDILNDKVPRRTGPGATFGDAFYRVVYNHLPSALVSARCFVCEKDIRNEHRSVLNSL